MITKRGRRVRALAIALLALGIFSIIVWAISNVYWVGDHYCVGSFIKCYYGGK